MIFIYLKFNTLSGMMMMTTTMKSMMMLDDDTVYRAVFRTLALFNVVPRVVNAFHIMVRRSGSRRDGCS